MRVVWSLLRHSVLFCSADSILLRAAAWAFFGIPIALVAMNGCDRPVVACSFELRTTAPQCTHQPTAITSHCQGCRL